MEELERNTTTCYCCEEEIDLDNEEYRELQDGNIICESCYESDYFTCYDCGDIVHNDDGRYIEDRDYYVCSDCADNYYECYECGNLYSEDCIHEYHGRYYCDECYNECCNIIGDYHDRDIGINFKCTEKDFEDDTIFANKNVSRIADNMLKFGMEIEVENNGGTGNNEMARMIRDKFPHLELVFEEDGSLDSGFEIITQPMTMSYIREHKEDFKELCEMLSKHDFVSHNAGSCGQHIHFSRCFFEDNDDKYVGNLLAFFERYKNEIYKFSRRDGTRWCSWVSDNAGYDKKYYKSSKILYDYAKSNTGHGVAINLEHSETIEIRVFRGTLKYETMMSNFEFVNALVHIIKEKPIRQINFDKVINYAGNEFIQNYCMEKSIYNSEYMSDETTNIFKELQDKKDKYENIKEDVKKNIQEVVGEMVDLSKKVMANVPELNKENEENIKQLLKTSTTLQNLITNNIDFINSSQLEKDETRVEDNYRQYIRSGVSYDYNSILRYYENIRNYLPANDYTNDLITKMDKVITTLREKYANGMGVEI